MPAALYKELNDPGGDIPHMIVVKKNAATVQNPSQISQPLLCQECGGKWCQEPFLAPFLLYPHPIAFS
jgi:hypothetical protein